MNTRSKGKVNYLAGPALMMDVKDAKTSSSHPHTSIQHDEHGKEGRNPGKSSTHILRENG